MTKLTARLMMMAAAASLSAGCAISNGPEHALSVAEEHPISVDSQIVTLTVDLDTTVDDLTSLDKARIRAFADSYLTNGHGPLTVTAPSGTGTDRDGQETAADIRSYLHSLGVDWSRITGATYRSGESSRQLVLSYTHYVATPSECGVWTGTKMRDFRNLRSPNYGCATQNNIAALVADPHDLIAPADMTTADANARKRMLDAYREGAVTSSATDGQIQAEVSN